MTDAADIIAYAIDADTPLMPPMMLMSATLPPFITVIIYIIRRCRFISFAYRAG